MNRACVATLCKSHLESRPTVLIRAGAIDPDAMSNLLNTGAALAVDGVTWPV